MATAGSVVQGHGARFAAACDVLSRYVKAAAAPAVVEQQRPVLPLMPGADLSLSLSAQEEAAPAPSSQLTISYGGQVVVLEDVPADKAAELLRAAVAAAPPRQRVLRLRAAAKEEDDDDLLPMARTASLQRFMEKRKGRAAAARGSSSPYSRRPEAAVPPSSSFRDHLALTL